MLLNTTKLKFFTNCLQKFDQKYDKFKHLFFCCIANQTFELCKQNLLKEIMLFNSLDVMSVKFDFSERGASLTNWKNDNIIVFGKSC
jgi:hypothetical protein